MQIVVDDQIFVVGLSELFRQEMKNYEISHLLPLAESICASLGLSPADVPVEGYYAESTELERFFRLIRTLQNTENSKTVSNSTSAMLRLREVLNSPAMGRVVSNDQLLPRTTSPFGEALQILSNWSIEGLSGQARKLVTKDDSSLLAVAAVAGDPVGLCVARESMALMSDSELAETPSSEFEWKVSAPVTEVAARFVSNLRKTTGIVLPTPEATSSQAYGQAFKEAELLGRCILIGEQFGNTYPYYHWYIDLQNDRPKVKDFWSNVVWTTTMLRNLPFDSRPPTGARLGAPFGDGVLSHGIHQQQPAPKRWFARLFK